MTPLCRKPVLLLVFLATVMCGCARKKPVLVVPTEQPPVVAPTPAPTPEAKAEPSPSPAATPAEQPEEKADTAGSAGETDNKAKPKSHHHAAVKKPSPAVRAEEQKPAEARSTPAPISPTISPGDAKRDQASTEQLLQNTEANLNGIKRQLSKDEQGMVTQIRSFINQSRQATKDNDPARARTLAMKANLLSNELVRR